MSLMTVPQALASALVTSPDSLPVSGLVVTRILSVPSAVTTGACTPAASTASVAEVTVHEMLGVTNSAPPLNSMP